LPTDKIGGIEDHLNLWVNHQNKTNYIDKVLICGIFIIYWLLFDQFG